jgi:hypothetical protein
MLWDLNEGKRLYSLDAGSQINSLTFSPNRYWFALPPTRTSPSGTWNPSKLLLN